MHFQLGYAVLSIVSLLSIISCIYVCLSLILNGYTPCKSTNYQSLIIIIDIIFWICITDGLIGLRSLCMFTPEIFIDFKDIEHGWFYDGFKDTMCDILSIVDIFFRIQNSILHIILACNFIYILRLKTFEKLLKNQKKYCCVIISTLIIVRSEFVFIYPVYCFIVNFRFQVYLWY